MIFWKSSENFGFLERFIDFVDGEVHKLCLWKSSASLGVWRVGCGLFALVGRYKKTF